MQKDTKGLDEADLNGVTGGGKPRPRPRMRFNPKAKLDASQVEDRRPKNPGPYTGPYLRWNSKGKIDLGYQKNGRVVW